MPFQKFDSSIARDPIPNGYAIHRGLDSRCRRKPFNSLEILSPLAATSQKIEIQVEEVMIFWTLRNLNIKTENDALS